MSNILKHSIDNITTEFHNYKLYKDNYDYFLNLPAYKKLVNENKIIIAENRKLFKIISHLSKVKKVKKLRKEKKEKLNESVILNNTEDCVVIETEKPEKPNIVYKLIENETQKVTVCEDDVFDVNYDGTMEYDGEEVDVEQETEEEHEVENDDVNDDVVYSDESDAEQEEEVEEEVGEEVEQEEEEVEEEVGEEVEQEEEEVDEEVEEEVDEEVEEEVEEEVGEEVEEEVDEEVEEEVEEEQEEDEEEVDEIVVNGKTYYLSSKNGNIYDTDSEGNIILEAVGHLIDGKPQLNNQEKKIIIKKKK